MDELIKKLKDNKVGWMFLSKDEQDCMKQANDEGMIQNLKYDGDWEGFAKPWALLGHGSNEIFRIKPDYQPEQEFVDLEIVKHSQVTVEQNWWLGVWKYSDLEEHKFLPYLFTHLHCLPSLPNFQGFFVGDMRIRCEEVSTHMEGKPYARFRK